MASYLADKSNATADVSDLERVNSDVIASDSSTAYDYIEPSGMTSRSREASEIGIICLICLNMSIKVGGCVSVQREETLSSRVLLASNT